jgi:hypothetical protein
MGPPPRCLEYHYSLRENGIMLAKISAISFAILTVGGKAEAV